MTTEEAKEKLYRLSKKHRKEVETMARRQIRERLDILSAWAKENSRFAIGDYVGYRPPLSPVTQNRPNRRGIIKVVEITPAMSSNGDIFMRYIGRNVETGSINALDDHKNELVLFTKQEVCYKLGPMTVFMVDPFWEMEQIKRKNGAK